MCKIACNRQHFPYSVHFYYYCLQPSGHHTTMHFPATGHAGNSGQDHLHAHEDHAQHQHTHASDNDSPPHILVSVHLQKN